MLACLQQAKNERNQFDDELIAVSTFSLVEVSEK
jgi:hypothetical protein